MTSKQHLAELKNLLMHDKQFKNVYTYFFDHLGENSAFLDNGERELDSRLLPVLQRIAEELLKKPVTTTDLLIVRVKDEPFLHGSGVIGGHLMTFFYFEDIGTGLAAVVPLRQSNKTDFIRFSSRPKPPPEPSVN